MQQKDIKISVIIPVYNTERYLKKCLDSLVGQSLKDIEIIIVNDGSPDGSQNIIDTYSEQYENIKAFQKENGGQASARNFGMNIAQGEYVAFADSDDYLPENAYKTLYGYAERFHSDIIVGINQSFNQYRKWIHEHFLLYFNRVKANTHIKEEQFLSQDVSPCNKLFKRSFLDSINLYFPENTAKEDVYFTRIAYFESKTTTIIPEIVYYYRGRSFASNKSGTQRIDSKYILDIVNISNKLKIYYEENNLLEYWPESIKHTCKMLENRIVKNIIASPYKDQLALCGELGHFFIDIDDEVFETFSFFQKVLYGLLREGMHDQAIMVATGQNLIWLSNQLKLSKVTNRTLANFAAYCLSKRNKFPKPKFIFRVYKRKIRQKFKYYGKRIIVKSTATVIGHRKYGIKRFIDKKPSVWLIGERRAASAQDNSFFFFKYCRENFSDNDIYFVIKKDSPDRKKVLPLGNVVLYGSIKHIRLAIKATVFAFNDSISDILPAYLLWIVRSNDNLSIFLQHGVVATGSIHRNYNKIKYNYFDKIITSSDSEKEIFHKHMSFKRDEIETTGLARWDELFNAKSDHSKRHILLAPSWRHWLKNDDKFNHSKYFYVYNSLLNSARLEKILEQNDLTLLFSPHFNIQGFIDQFSSKTDRVKIVSQKNTPLYKLIAESKMLITDYSSISFDFLFKDKPVILYTFDFIEWATFKQGGGYYDYQTDLPMDVVENENILLDRLEWYISNNFILRKEHKERMTQFFKYRDQNNCKRIYKCIEHLAHHRGVNKIEQ